jgi:hypothetical protein
VGNGLIDETITEHGYTVTLGNGSIDEISAGE